MAVVRVVKDKNNPYVMLNKACLKDERISWKAKGLHSYLLSLPDDWQIYIEDLRKRSKDGRDSTSSAINELIKNGYIKRYARQDKESGKFIGGFDYEVYELPIEDVNYIDDRESENPKIGETESRKNRESENPKLLNNKYKLNNEINKLIINYYQKYVGVITPNHIIKLLSYLDDDMEHEVIISAIDEMVGANIRDIRYLFKILNNWIEKGIKNSAQLIEHTNIYKNKNSRSNSINQNKVKDNSFGGNSYGKDSTNNESKLDSGYKEEVDVKELAGKYGIDISEI
ncbi:DnaD domain protein [Faecalimicrobium sp. JNUCC 81]